MTWALSTLIALTVSSAGLVGQATVTDQEKNIHVYIELFRSDLRNDRAQLVGAVMQLNAEEARPIWNLN